MKTNRIPQNQAELDARIEAVNCRQTELDPEAIMGMLRGHCLGGSVSPLELRYRYRTRTWMRNPSDMTHGGMIATMFDNAMGMSARMFAPEDCIAPTAELHISYLKPVPLETTLHIRVLVDHVSGRMIRMRAELRLGDGSDTLYATAMGINCPVKAN